MHRAEVRALIDDVLVDGGDGRRYLFGRPENDGVLGLAVTTGDADGECHLMVIVEKWDPSAASLVEQLQSRVGEEVVVRVTGRFEPQSSVLAAEVRPLEPGCCVGAHGTGYVGTLGGFVVAEDGQVGMLSNAHVLSPTLVGEVGASVTQPGGAPEASSSVARVSRALEVRPNQTAPIDAAVAVLLDGVEFAADPQQVETPLTLDDATVAAGDIEVYKIGRTTGRTTAHVVAVDAVMPPIAYETGYVVLEGLLVIRSRSGRPFTESGDSGAIVRDARSSRPIGLHVAGAGDVSVCHPIAPVLDALDVRLCLPTV